MKTNLLSNDGGSFFCCTIVKGGIESFKDFEGILLPISKKDVDKFKTKINKAYPKQRKKNKNGQPF